MSNLPAILLCMMYDDVLYICQFMSDVFVLYIRTDDTSVKSVKRINKPTCLYISVILSEPLIKCFESKLFLLFWKIEITYL